MIQFNGQVTINGNVEMYDNGSMHINAPVVLSVNDLVLFVNQNLANSSRKEDYLSAANALQTSSDYNVLKNAFLQLKDMAAEYGKKITLVGLSKVASDVFHTFGG